MAFVSCSDSEDTLSGHGGNTEALIISVDVKDANGLSVLLTSDVDAEKFTVTVSVKEGSDVKKLKLEAALSEGATIKPAMEKFTDFLIPVKLAVTSEDGNLTNNWFVIVKEERPSDAFLLSIDDMKNENEVSILVSSEIDAENMTASIMVKERSDTKNLKLNAFISEGASIDPALGVLTDFSIPVEYTITSKNGKSVNKWVVNVIVEEFIDYDGGFDYDLDPLEWILDAAKSDNFDSWDETRWQHYSGHVSDGFDHDPDNIIMENGKLRIVVDAVGDRYSSGKIKSTFEVSENSYVKIRAKMVNYQAMVNSSVILQDEDISPNVKIALMESPLAGNPDVVSTSLGQGDESIDRQTNSTGVELHGDYHVYGLERRNEYLRFFFDGKMIWEFETAQYPDLSRQLLNLVIGIDGKNSVEPNNARLPGYLLVDYVEIYNAAHTEEIVPSYGDNLVENPGFESAQGNAAPESWTITKKSGSTEVWVFRNWGTGGAQSSRFHFGKTSAPSTFDYTVSQTINDLPDGLYRLEVWAYMLDGYADFDPKPRLFASGHGGSAKEVFIDNVGPEYNNQNAWQRYIIDNIYVNSGSCEIGVQAIGDGNARLFIDDFRFVKVNY